MQQCRVVSSPECETAVSIILRIPNIERKECSWPNFTVRYTVIASHPSQIPVFSNKVNNSRLLREGESKSIADIPPSLSLSLSFSL